MASETEDLIIEKGKACSFYRKGRIPTSSSSFFMFILAALEYLQGGPSGWIAGLRSWDDFDSGCSTFCLVLLGLTWK